MKFTITGQLKKLDPHRGKMASISIRDNERGQHWLIYLDLQHSDFADLIDAKLGSVVEVKGFVIQKGDKTFFIAQNVVTLM